MPNTVKRPELSREKLLPVLAAHVLQYGLQASSLRPLAKAAGTSDRMLIYHFGNKERLVADTLAFIAQTYADALDTSFGGISAKTREECVERILKHTSSAEMAPFLALWWEIVAGSARGTPGYQEAAEAIMSKLLGWLEAHMPADDPDPEGGARFLLTVIEGSEMLRTIGMSQVAKEGLAANNL